jgi:hypothetical protein
MPGPIITRSRVEYAYETQPPECKVDTFHPGVGVFISPDHVFHRVRSAMVGQPVNDRCDHQWGSRWDCEEQAGMKGI